MTRTHHSARRTPVTRWRQGAAALALLSLAVAVGTVLPSAAAWVDPGDVSSTFSAAEAATTDVADACAGDGFTILATTEGAVFGVGNNASRSIGTGGSSANLTQIDFPEGTQITQVACGVNAVSALDSTGTAWVWGAGNGTPRSVTLPTSSPVTEVSSGGYFHLVLTADGAMYSWGNNGGGRLGRSALGSTGSETTPGPVDAVPADTPVVGINAGRTSAVAWTADGRAYAWGGAQYNSERGAQLRFEDESDDTQDGGTDTIPTSAVLETTAGTDDQSTPTDVGSSGGASDQITEARDTADASGADSAPQITDPTPEPAGDQPDDTEQHDPGVPTEPAQPDDDPAVSRSAAVDEPQTTSVVNSLDQIVSADISSMAVYVVDGSGTTWRAPRERDTPLTPWVLASGLDVVEVATTFSAESLTLDHEVGSFLLTRDGELYGFGDNSSGQLGLDPTTYPYIANPVLIPTTEPPVIFATGDSHSVLVTATHRLYVAGDNTFGQSASGNAGDEPIAPFRLYPMRYWPSA